MVAHYFVTVFAKNKGLMLLFGLAFMYCRADYIITLQRIMSQHLLHAKNTTSCICIFWHTHSLERFSSASQS